jgi:exodeoxyribonuclease-5/deoxyribonuclease V
MILAFDTYYFDNKAKTVSICFDDWSDEENYKVETEVIENSEEYQSGEFIKENYLVFLSLLDKIETQNVTTIIIDGFVYLDDNQNLAWEDIYTYSFKVRYQ